MVTWEQLEAACQNCRKCPLWQTRTNVVTGVGNREADVLFVGEGPGEQEDLRGEPFVGPAGQLLDKMLAAIQLDRKQVYIANVVKCRPPKNRDPLPEEQAACIHYLRAQTRLIRPKIIVCLGRIAASRLIHDNYKITREHGQWAERDGILYTAIYHPAALLRDPSKKPDTFADLRAIREKIRQVCAHTQVFPPKG